MTVTVNNQEIRIFNGATAKHAILRYLLRNKLDVKKVDNLVIKDKYGHQIDGDAPLSNGQTITFKTA